MHPASQQMILFYTVSPADWRNVGTVGVDRFLINSVARFLINCVERFLINSVDRFLINCVERFLITCVDRFLITCVDRFLINCVDRFLINLISIFIHLRYVRFARQPYKVHNLMMLLFTMYKYAYMLIHKRRGNWINGIFSKLDRVIFGQ